MSETNVDVQTPETKLTCDWCGDELPALVDNGQRCVVLSEGYAERELTTPESWDSWEPEATETHVLCDACGAEASRAIAKVAVERCARKAR